MSRYALWSVCLVACAIGLGIWLGLTDRTAPTQSTFNQAASIEKSDSTTRPSSAPAASGLSTTVKTEAKDTDANELQQLTPLLAKRRYDEAVELYRLLYNKLSEVDSAPYRDKIFSFAQELGSQGQHDEAAALLREYLKIFYQDLTALRMLAHSQHVLKRYTDEIETLFAALDVAYQIHNIDSFNESLNAAIAAQAVFLSNDPNAVLAFYQSLTKRKPEYEALQLGLSRALLRAGQKEPAIAILSALPKESEHQHEINELLVSAQQNRFSDTTAAPIQRLGDAFSVRVVMNGILPVTLLIDTGATLTIIHPNVLQLVGVNIQQPKSTVQLKTANGILKVPVFQLRSLALGDQLVSDIEVGGIAMSGMSGVNGLLGMNFLNHFKFTLDQQQQLLLLAR